MKILRSVLTLDQSKMNVIVEMPDGRKRMMEITWTSKERTNVPPSNWYEMIEAEIAYKDSEQLAARTGRRLPR